MHQHTVIYMQWPFGLGEFSINCYCLWFMLLFRVVEGNKIKGPSVMIIKDHKLLFQFTFVFFIFLLFLCRFEFNVSIGEFSRPTYAVYNENRKRNKTLMAILNNFWGINATFRCQSCAVWKKIGVRYYSIFVPPAWQAGLWPALNSAAGPGWLLARAGLPPLLQSHVSMLWLCAFVAEVFFLFSHCTPQGA